mmetsp:Transcript_14561/g.29110  ORF Transcript_14561/g.29110 Transcript_14561/m.29110 type:complete len:174 (-) Transcript_14561:384-905(-)|eukprot:CAMPEP_0181319310 /NCGR_PEP_ID=MMETSP1101-20121128/17497_1 /TAXON_ID=46948 /ORGANISM="Rhodomonas abbreviata, Strain Caron Lab Isolate" /LENGTH=173 /DNA_ID=CAMNT_0023426889 /DNA_START=386 /DNA_END=907 /DNA_ORIENTATION=+
MALLRVKRPLDLEGLNDALPPTCSGAAHLFSADSAAELAQASKRQRFNEMMAAAAASAGVPIGAGVRDSPFVSPKPVETKEIEKIIHTSLNSPRRGCGDGDFSPAERQSEKRYTFEEVTSILNKALHDREQMLREEYNKVLHTKLAEQFQSFTKFNQDYISRQIKGNPFSYVS